MPVCLLTYGPIRNYGCYTHSGQSITLWLPACDGSHNLGTVGYLQVPFYLLWGPLDIILPTVGVPGTHTRLYGI